MSGEKSVSVNYVDWTKLMPNPPLISSFQANWNSIQIAHYCHPKLDLPKISNTQHVLNIPLGNSSVDFDFVAEGRSQVVSYREEDYAGGCIEIYPANLPISLHSHSTTKYMELIQCYLEPSLLARVAHESVKPDRIEIPLTLKKADSLLVQIGVALRSTLELDGGKSRFYADSMATALSAHLLQHYSTHNHRFREYKNGLPKRKLRQAIDYIQAHLSEDLSLSEIADEVGISQYYFCRLFKQSTGSSPHKYLISQRVERAKQLLKHLDKTITFIALECGFANQSHFAKCFRQHTGISPKDFRNL